MTIENPDNPADIDRVLRLADRELWIVTAQSEGRLGGLVSTTVTSASIVAGCPRILLTVARQHATWSLIESSGSFALHLVRETDSDLIWRFGTSTGHDPAVDKFADCPYRTGSTGSPILERAAATLECRVEAGWNIGDRSAYLGAVLRGSIPEDFQPLTIVQLMQQASEKQKMLLRELRERDAVVDERAIRNWRAQTGR